LGEVLKELREIREKEKKPPFDMVRRKYLKELSDPTGCCFPFTSKIARESLGMNRELIVDSLLFACSTPNRVYTEKCMRMFRYFLNSRCMSEYFGYERVR